MALDVEIPEPPDLSNRGKPRDFEMPDAGSTPDFHREDLEAILHDTAWTMGFEEWLDRTDLTADHVEVVAAMGLFREFDFYWNPADEQLRDDPPSVPEDWRDLPETADLDSSDVSLIDAELQDLARTVREALEDELERSDAVSASLWVEESYGDRES